MSEEFIGYCVKCHAQRVVLVTAQSVSRARGRYVTGDCPECGARVGREFEPPSFDLARLLGLS